MSKHDDSLNFLKSLKSKDKNYFKDPLVKPKIIEGVIHAADISNGSRPFEIAKRWGERIFKEFFSQGDKEKALGLEISMLCDRSTENFASCQINFLSGMILPYYTSLQPIIPRLEEQCKQLKSNIEDYKKKVEEFEEVKA